MTGYISKKLMAESREPDVPDVSYHYRETADMRFESADPHLFYNLRHLKQFQERTKSNKTKWFCSWDDETIHIYDVQNKLICKLDDIVLAEYITSLHNMSIRMIKEIESKYDRSF
jgi:hypothetical protein